MAGFLLLNNSMELLNDTKIEKAWWVCHAKNQPDLISAVE